MSIFPLDELHTLLAEARAADTALKRFGAAKHRYQWQSPASPSEVEAFEREIGVTLPADYRDFLLQASNGGAGPFYGLFSLEEVRSWLQWQVEPENPPCLRPGISANDLDAEENWRRGCIPIGSQGCTYFTYLMVTGSDRGRVVYVEYDGLWIFFPYETNFLAWYTRWLREVANGYHICWFGTYLDGDEEFLRQYYAQAATDEERLLALDSMTKFPSLSEATCDFLQRIMPNWLIVAEVGHLPELFYRADPTLYEKFLDDRWALGLYDTVIYDLYHTPADRDTLAKRWQARILTHLADISPESYCITLPLLKQGGDVQLEQVAFLLDKAQGQTKYELLRHFGHLPDAKDHLELWLSLLTERDDLEQLRYALLSVPRMSDDRLLHAVQQVQNDLPLAMERIIHVDYNDERSLALSIRRDAERNIYHLTCEILQDIFYETINPLDRLLPRPYRLEMLYHASRDLGMDLPAPPNGIALHPLIALTIRQENNDRLPSTAWDWNKKLNKIKKLDLALSNKTVCQWNDADRLAYIRPPDEHFPPTPYYFALRDWSVIERMTNLRDLRISQICVEDFSFLAACKNLQTLSLYNTNFTDCRLLHDLPKLKRVDLRMCRLTHTEVLDELSIQYEI